MLGCEIIEEYEAGNVILWSRARAEKVMAQHGADPAEFANEWFFAARKDEKIAAAKVLIWLGY
jgi:hypothetical protein